MTTKDHKGIYYNESIARDAQDALERPGDDLLPEYKLPTLEKTLQVYDYGNTQYISSHVSADFRTVRKIKYDFSNSEDLKNEFSALHLLRQHDKTKIQAQISRLAGRYEILDYNYVKGVTLEDTWDGMTEGQRKEVISATRLYIERLQDIKNDRITRANKSLGPSWNGLDWARPICVQDFLMNVVRRYTDNKLVLDWASIRVHPISDEGTTSLTHLDVHPGNIIVDEKNMEFVTLIDWESAGFYPHWFLALDLLVYRQDHDFVERLLKGMFPTGNLANHLLDLADMFKALRIFAEPHLEPNLRQQNREEGWAALVKLIPGLDSQTPSFDYTNMRTTSYSGTQHYLWKEAVNI